MGKGGRGVGKYNCVFSWLLQNGIEHDISTFRLMGRKKKRGKAIYRFPDLIRYISN
jgi:hypothetical protein